MPRPRLIRMLIIAFIVSTSLSPVYGQSGEPKGELSIVIDLSSRSLTVYSNGEFFKRFTVAVGKPDTPSPVGEWRIVQKSKDWGGGFGTRWLGLNVPWGIYGIHGTNKPYSIGARASAGCFRMHNANVEQLYEWITVGTPVTVIGPERSWRYSKVLHQGSTGQEVVHLQLSLRKAGFDAGPADGRFGPLTSGAITAFRQLYDLPANDGVAGEDLYYLLEVHNH